MKLEKFFEYLKIVFINMFTIWMMSAKMVTLGLPKIKVFEIKFMQYNFFL